MDAIRIEKEGKAKIRLIYPKVTHVICFLYTPQTIAVSTETVETTPLNNSTCFSVYSNAVLLLLLLSSSICSEKSTNAGIGD
jgi:hypothetical protein